MLLAEPGGTSHARLLVRQPVLDSTIADYLTTSDLPPRNDNAPWDNTCAPPLVPVPAATPSAAAQGAGGVARHALRLRLRRAGRGGL